jgi:hypothetical protein
MRGGVDDLKAEGFFGMAGLKTAPDWLNLQLKRLPAPGKTGTAARYGKMPEAPPDDEGQKHKKMAQELAKSVLENRARSEEQQKEFDAAFKDF